MIHKFKATVTITKDVVIQIDDTIFDETAMQEFREGFNDAADYQEHAEQIASYVAENGGVLGLEGYSDGAQWKTDFKNIDPSHSWGYAEVSSDGGVRVQIVDEDSEVNVVEVKDEHGN